MANVLAAETLLAIHFDGADGSSIFTDEKGHTVSGSSFPTISATRSKFGGTSLKLSGSNYVRVMDGSDIALGTGDFAIEGQVFRERSGVTEYLYDGRPNSTNGPYPALYISTGDRLIWYVNGAYAITGSGTISPGAFHHVSACRSDGTTRLFLDGVPQGVWADSTDYQPASFRPMIGANGYTNGGQQFQGYVDDLLVVRSALYAAAFTPPTSAFTISAGMETGAAQVPVSVLVAPAGMADVPIEVEAVPGGVAAVAVDVRTGPVGQGGVDLVISVVPPAIAIGAASAADGTWAVAVTLGGADVTNSVIGEIVVEGEEGAARIADFTIRPDPGTEIYLPGWTGRPVRISIADMSTGTPRYAMPLFSGIVDLPSLDLDAGTIALRCTDDLQGKVAGMTRVEIEAAIGGHWSAAVFDAAAGGWAYAQDRLSTVPASFDLDVYGAARLTPWQAKSGADILFDSDSIEDGSLSVELSNRASLVNTVEIDFGYRIPRLKAEAHRLSLDIVGLTGFSDFVQEGRVYLSRSAIESAIAEAGGKILTIDYTALPDVPTPILLLDGSTTMWLPSPSDASLCLGFDAAVTFSYSQTIDEQHSITVSNAASVAAIGRIRQSMSGAMEGKYPDRETWETQTALYQVAGIKASAPFDIVTPVAGHLVEQDGTLTQDTNRAAANAAMEALVATAKVKIWQAHRGNRVSWTETINPAIDLDKTLEVVHRGVHAKGKCRAFKHRLNPETARAVTEVSIAICAVSGVGVSHPETPTVAPAGTEPQVKVMTGIPTATYDSSAAGDHVLHMTFPGVDDAERDNAVVEIDTAFDAGFVEDLFTVTV